MLENYRLIEVSVAGVPGPVKTAYVGPCLDGMARDDRCQEAPPFLLLHGFDSSAAEWRRVYPTLARRADTYAIDILGSGFTDVSCYIGNPRPPLGPAQIRENLYGFWKQEIGRPVIVVGASLGGTVAMDFALHHPDAVDKIVLIDPQGYIDGIGPVSKGPEFIARLGVMALRTVLLREAVGKVAYYNKAKFATRDAMLVARLHTFCRGWLDAKLAFIKSGGYMDISKRVRDVDQDVLLLWGKQDEILDLKYVKEFQRDLKRVTTVLIDECGHVAHLEQSTACANAVLEFASTDSPVLA